MDRIIVEWLGEFVAAHGPFRRVLELGSLDVNGTPRAAFVGTSEYVGVDARDGPGVDVVMDTSMLWHWSEMKKFDCVVATSFFEHDRAFWKTLPGIHEHLKQGGWFVLTVPTLDFPVHEYPGDYYRFTAQAVREVLMEGLHEVELFNPLWQHPPESPHLRCQHIGAYGHA